MIPDFRIDKQGPWTELLQDRGISTFAELCLYVQDLPYGRNSDRHDFMQVLTEGKGTCSSKHGLLATIAEAHAQTELHLMAGIFLMSSKTHPELAEILEKYQLNAIPEAHAYFRFDNNRYDFTDKHRSIAQIEPFIVREQRCEPNQLIDWKPMIHRHYIDSWTKRQKSGYSSDEIWDIREQCISRLSENR